MNNEQLTELLRKLEQEWAPALLETAAKITFYDSLGWIIAGFVWLIVGLIMLRLASEVYIIGCS